MAVRNIPSKRTVPTLKDNAKGGVACGRITSEENKREYQN